MSAKHCQAAGCDVEFNLLHSKHPCKKCNLVLCQKHCTKQVTLSPKGEFVASGGKDTKVCDNCHIAYEAFLRRQKRQSADANASVYKEASVKAPRKSEVGDATRERARATRHASSIKGMLTGTSDGGDSPRNSVRASVVRSSDSLMPATVSRRNSSQPATVTKEDVKPAEPATNKLKKVAHKMMMAKRLGVASEWRPTAAVQGDEDTMVKEEKDSMNTFDLDEDSGEDDSSDDDKDDGTGILQTMGGNDEASDDENVGLTPRDGRGRSASMAVGSNRSRRERVLLLWKEKQLSEQNAQRHMKSNLQFTEERLAGCRTVPQLPIPLRVAKFPALAARKTALMEDNQLWKITYSAGGIMLSALRGTKKDAHGKKVERILLLTKKVIYVVDPKDLKTPKRKIMLSNVEGILEEEENPRLVGIVAQQNEYDLDIEAPELDSKEHFIAAMSQAMQAMGQVLKLWKVKNMDSFIRYSKADKGKSLFIPMKNGIQDMQHFANYPNVTAHLLAHGDATVYISCPITVPADHWMAITDFAINVFDASHNLVYRALICDMKYMVSSSKHRSLFSFAMNDEREETLVLRLRCRPLILDFFRKARPGMQVVEHDEHQRRRRFVEAAAEFTADIDAEERMQAEELKKKLEEAIAKTRQECETEFAERMAQAKEKLQSHFTLRERVLMTQVEEMQHQREAERLRDAQEAASLLQQYEGQAEKEKQARIAATQRATQEETKFKAEIDRLKATVQKIADSGKKGAERNTAATLLSVEKERSEMATEKVRLALRSTEQSAEIARLTASLESAEGRQGLQGVLLENYKKELAGLNAKMKEARKELAELRAYKAALEHEKASAIEGIRGTNPELLAEFGIVGDVNEKELDGATLWQVLFKVVKSYLKLREQKETVQGRKEQLVHFAVRQHNALMRSGPVPVLNDPDVMAAVPQLLAKEQADRERKEKRERENERRQWQNKERDWLQATFDVGVAHTADQEISERRQIALQLATSLLNRQHLAKVAAAEDLAALRAKALETVQTAVIEQNTQRAAEDAKKARESADFSALTNEQITRLQEEAKQAEVKMQDLETEHKRQIEELQSTHTKAVESIEDGWKSRQGMEGDELRTRIVELEGESKKLAEQVTQRDTEAQKLLEQLAERESEANSLREQASQREAESKKFQEQVTERETEAQNLRDQVTQAKAAAEAQLQEEAHKWEEKSKSEAASIAKSVEDELSVSLEQSVREKLRDEVRASVEAEAREKLRDEVRAAVEAEVRVSVEAEAKEKAETATRDVEATHAKEADMRKELEAQLKAKFDEELNAKLNEERGKIEADLKSKFDAELNTTVAAEKEKIIIQLKAQQDEDREKVEGNLQRDIQSQRDADQVKFDAELKSKLEAEREKFDAELKSKVEAEKAKAEAEKEKLDAELKSKLEAEKAKFDEELKSRMDAERPKINDELQAKHEAELKTKLEAERTKIESELRGVIDAEIRGKVETEIQARLAEEVRQHVAEERRVWELDANAKSNVREAELNQQMERTLADRTAALKVQQDTEQAVLAQQWEHVWAAAASAISERVEVELRVRLDAANAHDENKKSDPKKDPPKSVSNGNGYTQAPSPINGITASPGSPLAGSVGASREFVEKVALDLAEMESARIAELRAHHLHEIRVAEQRLHTSEEHRRAIEHRLRDCHLQMEASQSQLHSIQHKIQAWRTRHPTSPSPLGSPVSSAHGSPMSSSRLPPTSPRQDLALQTQALLARINHLRNSSPTAAPSP